MSRRAVRLSLLLLGAAVVYFAIPALLLCYSLETFLFRPSGNGTTHEDQRIEIPVGEERTVIARRYVAQQSTGCIVFFPGQRGGISNYEQSLFPMLEAARATLYTVSYPGHDGARGHSSRATLLKDVEKALAVIGQDAECDPQRTVFVGRSQGATVAIAAAVGFKPKGLIVEGASPTLTSAIEAAMRRSPFTRAWTILPIRWLVGEDYALVPLIQELQPTPVVVFQGTEDTVTPFDNARRALSGLPNVEFIRVEGATHGNACLVAAPIFALKLSALLER